jgi:4-amino-4-deoxy-L-arabinose transferase-like glycosyltransferase
VSILFSLGTLLLVKRTAGFLFNRWTGALAMFFLAVLPASTVFDSWIKEDALAVFFLTLTIYLFVRKKYVWSGVALGLGMLSKEIAVFSLLAIGIYVLTCWQRDQVLGMVKVGLIGAVISFWWYFFVSSSVGLFGGFFLGTNNEAAVWAFPWHFYLSGLPDDLGWCILAAAAVGMAACFWRRFQGSRVHMLPVAWFIPIYVFISFSVGKPHWMVSSALPAAAMLAAIGTVESAKWLGGHISSARLARVAQISLVGTLMLWAFLGAVLPAARNTISHAFPAVS